MYTKQSDKIALTLDLSLAFQGMAIEKTIKEKGNLKFLNKFLRVKKDDLRIQLVFKSLPYIAKIYPLETFDFLKEHIGKKKKLEAYIKDDYTRQELISVAEELVKADMGEEALWIIDRFSSDVDPRNEEIGDFNYHNQIKGGKEVINISTVRGKIPWVLQELANDQRYYLDTFLRLKNIIENENNLYVIQQSIVPLIVIVNMRVWFKDESRLLELHQLIFDLLRNFYSYPSIAKMLLRLLNRYRDINDKEAREVIDRLIYIPEVAPLLIYYAIFRKHMYQEKEKFDPTKIQIILKSQIEKGEDEMRRQIAANFVNILEGDHAKLDSISEYLDIFYVSFNSNHTLSYLFKIINLCIDNHYLKAIEWLEKLFVNIIENCKADTTTLNVGISMRLYEIIEKIAIVSTRDYLKIIELITQLSLLNEVVTYDLKRIFQSHNLLNIKDKKKVLPKLESCWDVLTKKNPYLVEVNWKN